MTDYSVKRDRWGRPWVSTDGGPLQYKKGRVSPINAEGYTRVSTLAGALDDKANLIDWAASNAMVGMVRDRSIAAQVGSLAAKYGDPWNVPEGKTALKGLVERAKTTGGGDEASGLGTSAHEFTEVIDEGRWPEFIPVELEPWLREYRDLMRGVEVLEAELFVVNDELKCAGSMDKVLRMPDGRVVAADLKTGRHDPNYPLKLAIQLAVYANSSRYDQVSGERSLIHPDLDLSTAMLIHMPIRSGKKPYARFYPVDIEWGLDMARLAVAVREARSGERDRKLVAL